MLRMTDFYRAAYAARRWDSGGYLLMAAGRPGGRPSRCPSKNFVNLENLEIWSCFPRRPACGGYLIVPIVKRRKVR